MTRYGGFRKYAEHKELYNEHGNQAMHTLLAMINCFFSSEHTENRNICRLCSRSFLDFLLRNLLLEISASDDSTHQERYIP